MVAGSVRRERTALSRVKGETEKCAIACSWQGLRVQWSPFCFEVFWQRERVSSSLYFSMTNGDVNAVFLCMSGGGGGGAALSLHLTECTSRTILSASALSCNKRHLQKGRNLTQSCTK